MNKSLISLIIPTYNRECFIRETLDSVIKQSYLNWECIVVDDGSTDSTVSIIMGYAKKDSRIRLYHRIRNPKGAPTCRNIGLDNATGEFIMFLDSDDLLVDSCLELRLNYAREFPNHECWTFPSIYFSDTTNLNLNKFYYTTCDKHLFFAMLIRIQWPINSSFTKRNSLIKYNIRFDEKLQRWQDWQFHLEYIINGINIKRNHFLEYDVRIRKHNDDSSKISRRKKSTNRDIEGLLQLMIYLTKNLNANDSLLHKAMVLRWFICIEHIIYFYRGDMVDLFLTKMKESRLIIPYPYRILFLLPNKLYIAKTPSKFYNKLLCWLNLFYKHRILRSAKINKLC